jgi:protein TonB
MIPQFCFLQFVAVATTPNQQPSSFSRLRSSSQFKNLLNWLGLFIAAILHLCWLALMKGAEPKQVIAPPQTIMVNWISASAAKAPSPSVQQQPKALKPKLEPAKTKPKTQPSVVKPKPVVATNAESASSMTVPISEQPTPPERNSAEAELTPASSQTEKPSPDANQAPMTLPHLNADYLDKPALSYPSLSRQLGEQGKVLLRVLVNTDGKVEQISLRKTSGYDRLDTAAQETVKQWRFVAAKRGSETVAAWVVVPISFSLEG